ncbi:MAG: caspase family protein, partial [Pseudomonadota bacterium]
MSSVSFVSSTQAKTTALLIGVSDYDETIGLADLRGPVNDVKLMRDALQSRGVTDIRILADGIEGSARPTRNEIMSALAKLANEAADGDLYIIHMSGHGTRQPDDNDDEADGYDELFLPADVTRAEPGARQIPNAIVDEELGNAIDLIRKTGADVWFIMDACHSGTGLRAGGLNTADRYIDPSVLGISGVTSSNAGKNDDKLIVDRQKPDNLQGKLIAFYSAQADELAREVDFSSVDSSDTAPTNPDQNNWFGLFTAKLANRILSAGSISYRQLFQGIMADMNSTNVPGAARLQTPHWEGDLIDAVVLGGSDTVDVRQYQVDFDMLSAGAVHGIEIGTILELAAASATSSKMVPISIP